MKTEEKIEQNDLVVGMKSFWERLKSGKIIGPKMLGGILLVAMAGILWWWFSNQNRNANSALWRSMYTSREPAELKTLADANPNTNLANLSKIKLIRMNLNSGLEMLASQTTHRAGVVKVEQARTDTLALIETLKKSKDQVVLLAQSYYTASQAELALVGIWKEGVPISEQFDEKSHRGTVSASIGYLNEAVKVVGEATPAGEKLKKRIEELEKTKDIKDSIDNATPANLGRILHESLNIEPPPFTPQVGDPTKPSTNVKPDAVIQPPIITPTTTRTPTTTPTTVKP